MFFISDVDLNRILKRFRRFIWQMVKDKRYKLVKDQISGGHIKTFSEIFDIIPKTVVLKDLHIHNQRFNELMSDVRLFTLLQLYELAALIEIDGKIILDMAHHQYLADQKKKK